MAIEIKTFNDDYFDIGDFDPTDSTVELNLKDAMDHATTWIKRDDALQIINHLKEQFNL